MGAKVPQVFCTGSGCQLKHMMAKKRDKLVVVYLDDFLMIGCTWIECQEVFECLIKLLQ